MEESLRLFSDMRRGLMDEGSATLRCYTCCCPGVVTAALWSTNSAVNDLHTVCVTSAATSCLKLAKRACTGHCMALSLGCQRRNTAVFHHGTKETQV